MDENWTKLFTSLLSAVHFFTKSAYLLIIVKLVGSLLG